MKHKVKYYKDKGEYSGVKDYSGTFGKVDETAIQLINACKYVYKDPDGEYVYDAYLIDESKGLVGFNKRYIKKDPEQ